MLIQDFMKRIVVNILVAFILVPVLTLGRVYFMMEIMHDHSMFSGTFAEYVVLDPFLTFFLTPMIALFFILLPNYYALNYLGKRRRLNLLFKIIVLNTVFVLFICLIGTFSNIWVFPYWRNIIWLFYFLPASILLASTLHLLVDQKEGL